MPDEDRGLRQKINRAEELEKICLNKESTSILIFQIITF